MPNHRIHLRGPWQSTTDATGTLRIRRFGSPVRLDPGERVWLVILAITPSGTVRLNGIELARSMTQCEVEITDLLKSRNEMHIQTPGEGSLGEVYLEFRSAVENQEGRN